MNAMEVVSFLIVLFIVLGGAVSGWSAVMRIRRLRKQLLWLESRLTQTERRLRRLESEGVAAAPVAGLAPETPVAAVSAVSAPEAAEAPPPTVAEPEEPSPPMAEPTAPEAAVPRPPEPSPAPPAPEPPRPGRPSGSLELVLGTKWLGWAGMLLFLVGAALFLKYAYDNDWIGPAGRLAIGVVAGLVALGLGEYCRRRDWPALFQTLTGGGIAIFYICIYFSFEVYELSGSGVSIALATLVTVGAVVMAVAHNAVAIGILACIGGFLSPILLSTGENHPYLLFTYIAVLDLVALGAAYYRRWRALDLLCFFGTALIYLLWFGKFYDAPDQPSQFAPAMLFTTVFYLLFLVIPMLHNLVRRTGDEITGPILVVLNAACSFASYYAILFEDHRQPLGFAVLGQALLVFLLFRAYAHRVGVQNRTSPSLLTIALALVTIAVPIQLRLYGVPLAWAMEGVLFVYLGLRFNSRLTRGVGGVALLLAGVRLVDYLPLHSARFTPVWNEPFGSWTAVIAAAAIAGYLLIKRREDDAPWNLVLGGAAALLGFALGCALLSLEVADFWRFAPVKHPAIYRADSLTVLWALIPAATLFVLHRARVTSLMPLPLACYGLGALVFLVGLAEYDHPSTRFFLNNVFLSRLIFVAALWWGARRVPRQADIPWNRVVEAVGHGLLAVLLALECVRWTRFEDLLSDKMGFSLISALWAVQAFALVWLGLATGSRTRRYLGFVLFGLTIGKVLLVDTSELEKVYRIVSFLATGVFLLAASFFYHRYSEKLLSQQQTEDEP